jgi:hypothetical protein
MLNELNEAEFGKTNLAVFSFALCLHDPCWSTAKAGQRAEANQADPILDMQHACAIGLTQPSNQIARIFSIMLQKCVWFRTFGHLCVMQHTTSIHQLIKMEEVLANCVAVDQDDRPSGLLDCLEDDGTTIDLEKHSMCEEKEDEQKCPAGRHPTMESESDHGRNVPRGSPHCFDDDGSWAEWCFSGQDKPTGA